MNSFKRKTGEVRERIIAHFKKHNARPVIVGDLCRELHANLNEVLVWVDDLVDDGTLRQVSQTEAKKHGISLGYILS